MATYSAVSASEKDADSPVNVGVVDKLDQNPHAIAEGASGAPKIANAAFSDNTIDGGKLINDTVENDKLKKATSGGTAQMLKRLKINEVSTTSTSYVGVTTDGYFHALIDCSVRITWDMRVLAGTGWVEVSVNESQVNEQTTTSGSYVSKTYDATLNQGDKVEINFKNNSTGVYVRNLFVYSNTADTLGAC